MKMLRILIFGVVALAQLAVPATMVWQRHQTLKQGRIWKFRTAPVDPVESVWWWGGKQQVRFPFNKFWVAEANAAAAEHAYVENNRRDNQNAYVTVRVRRGDAALDQLYIDNQPLSEYLRAHSPQ